MVLNTGLPFILIPFVISGLLKVVQGSGTVAVRRRQRSALPLQPSLGLDPILIFGLNMGERARPWPPSPPRPSPPCGWCAFVRQAHQAADSAAASPSGRQGAGPGAGPGALTLIMQSTESLVNIAFNSSLKTYGGDPAVGAMTICSSIMQVFSLLFQGLSQGPSPLWL